MEKAYLKEQRMQLGKYKKAQENELNALNDMEYTMGVILNKKPIFENIEVSEITTTTATVKVRATDGDKEKLTYKLYMGTDIDNLEEKDIMQNIEQGIDIELTGTEIDTSVLWYYRIDVSDKYETIQSEISTLQNKKPVIEKAEITDITRTTAKAIIKGTDEDDENLIYKVYYGINRDTLDTEGKVTLKENVKAGIEENLEMKNLTLGTKYYYRIEVTDGVHIVTKIGEFTTKPNSLPSITPTITKDISIKSSPKQNTSWVQVSAKVEDLDIEDKLEIKIYLGTATANQLGTNDLIGSMKNAISRSNIYKEKR